MSRVENAGKNMMWQTLSTLITTGMNFVTRYIFITYLGAEYLGMEGLFTSVFGVLSFMDLGFAGAFTFCFYKAIAAKDHNHISILLNALRKIILAVMLAIGTLGVIMIPFLRFFVAGGTGIPDNQLTLYYVLTLCNTLVSYLFTYKTCYVTACQKAYLLVPLTTGFNIATVAIQLAVLWILQNYALYILTSIGCRLVQAFVVNSFINKRFPETKLKSRVPLPEEDREVILRNTKGLIWGKVGTVSVYQTDNIIISAGVSIVATGVVSNYNSVKMSVTGIISMIENALVPSMGDLISREDVDTQMRVFYTYLMLTSWLLGLAFCGIGILCTPFIQLIFGAAMILDNWSVFYICMGFYFAFLMYALNILPTAGGYINLGAYVAGIEGVVNLVVSLLAMHFMGLPGVFFGTAVSAIVAYILRPISVFKGMYQMSPTKFFKRTLMGYGTTMIIYVPLLGLRNAFYKSGEISIPAFLLLVCIVILLYTGVFWIFWRKDIYYQLFVKECKDYMSKKLHLKSQK